MQELPKPKVFISYSWSSEEHCERVRSWADRLIENGVEVYLDRYDLQRGQDKFAFMERMVTDKTVTHVLVICDRQYAEKANARKAGVGTESQIISAEVYGKVEQSKFIPIFCEYEDHGQGLPREPYRPVFMNGLMGFNFESPEQVNANWESLLRHLYGKPLDQKPALGKVPAFILEDSKAPSTPAASRFQVFKVVFLAGRRGIDSYRTDFFDAWFDHINASRAKPNSGEPLPEKVLETYENLIPSRDLIVDWVLLEIDGDEKFRDHLRDVVEKLLVLRSRPTDVTTWNDSWFEAHQVFACETFIYIVAALIKRDARGLLRWLFTTRYIQSETARNGSEMMAPFDSLWGYARSASAIYHPPQGGHYLNPSAELFKRHASRSDISFKDLMQAEALIFLMAAISDDKRWYPHTLIYAEYSVVFPLFLRAAQKEYFQRLNQITGCASAVQLRERAAAGLNRMHADRWEAYALYSVVSFPRLWNLDKLDTLT